MRTHYPVIVAILAVAGLTALPASASTCVPNSGIINIGDLAEGNSSANTGNFGCDSDEEVFNFSLDSLSQIQLYTTSWVTGGFAPILTLFDSAGNEITYNAGGQEPNACGPRGTSPGTFSDYTQTCLDAFLNPTLAAGSYTLVLTEQDNLAKGSYVANEAGYDTNYTKYGELAFTGYEWDQPGQTFLSPNNGDPLTSAWAVDLVNPAPEPVTGLMGLSGISLILMSVRRRGKRSQV
jgi:hypothetical protein